jgi:hypothetical protein
MTRILAGLLIGVALAAGCSSPMSRVDAPRDRAWFDTGTPASSLAPLRTTSFSVDDKGTVRDDSSRKQDSSK